MMTPMRLFLHRATALGCVCSVLVIAFYAGMKSYKDDPKYTPGEVQNLQQTCESGQYIGGCQDCASCERNEFDMGGCSFFRDTSCTLCEPMEHCDMDKTTCTSQRDSTCSHCDPGFWGDRFCKACTVCAKGTYQLNECTKDVDTQCIPCTPCESGLRLTKECTHLADTECSDCSSCMLGTFMERPCETMSASENAWEKLFTDPDIVHTLQADTDCQMCAQTCGEGTYTSGPCTITRDTECSECSACGEGEFIKTRCASGSAEMEGTDTECEDCLARPGENFWEITPCLSTAGSDSFFAECTVCLDWEWEESACGDTYDAVCPRCAAVGNCKEKKMTCTSGLDSVCTECEEGYFGEDCCYHKTFGECGRNSNRERTPYREGYRWGDTEGKLVDFCIDMCNDFPDCFAVEVIDGGDSFTASGPNKLGGSRDTVCHFMASYTVEAMEDPSMDCYSNTCRQGPTYEKVRTYSTEA